ncbi:MAG: minor capsid protein [Methanoregula sp.]|jgi:hypothetical protein|nr:minor capsid protein [Methanoregula sp.]
MMTIDIGHYLETGGIGTIETDIFLDYVPEDPDLCTILTQYAGNRPEMLLSGPGDESPGLQVRGRGARDGYEAGFARMKAVELLLSGLSNTTLTATAYKSIIPVGSIANLGYDEQGRPEWVQNYIVTKAV